MAETWMADVVVVSEGHVLLIKRKYEPFKGEYALPGGHLDEGEDPMDAARRELEEETGIRVDELRLIGVYDAQGRDPRGPTRSHAYRAQVEKPVNPIAADDAESVEWIPLEKARGLAFDHDRILADALERHI